MGRLIAAVMTLFFLAAVLAPARAQLFETKAKQAFVIDAETGTVLFSKNPDELFPPASIAKLMTMEVVFDALKSGRLSLEETFFVSEHAWRTGGAPSGTATMFAEVNSSVPLEALVKGAMVHSANDACIVIAEGMAGSEENFAVLMTERARIIGLENSVFANPTGLPAEGQYVTAREMTELARHLRREYPRFYQYFSLPDFEWNGIRQRNRNPLLGMRIGSDGLKTGFTEESGYAIVASAERNGRRVFATLGGMASEEERAEEARKIIDWAMRSFRIREFLPADAVVGEAQVYGGEKGRLPLRTDGPLSVLVPIAESERVSARIVYLGPLAAPIEEGAEVGRLQIWLGDTLSREVPLYATEPIAKGRLHRRALDAMGELLVGWMRDFGVSDIVGRF